jgi:ubiquitin carboxyl-terminal hydrolase 9/24
MTDPDNNNEKDSENEEKGEEKEKEKESPPEPVSTHYKLRGIIVHSGQASGGHYYSFILQR